MIPVELLGILLPFNGLTNHKEGADAQGLIKNKNLEILILICQ